jgi:hypothetical protein
MGPTPRAFSNAGQVNDVDLALGALGVTPEHSNRIPTNKDVAGTTAAVLMVKDPQKVDWKAVNKLLGSRLLRVNPYADEKADSERCYPKDYRPTAPSTQYNKLHKLYPKLDGTHIPEITRALGRLRKSEELYQVVPKLSIVARLHGIEDPFGTGYGQCLEIMLEHMGKAFPNFVNYRKGKLTDYNVRLLAETREYLEKLEAETPGDFLVIPMQSGKLYRGYSVQNARIEADNANQWVFPTWIVGHHLLTHPKRLPDEGFLSIDNGGDEYSPSAGGRFTSSLSFNFWDGLFKLDNNWASSVSPGYGSASGFRRE